MLGEQEEPGVAVHYQGFDNVEDALINYIVNGTPESITKIVEGIRASSLVNATKVERLEVPMQRSIQLMPGTVAAPYFALLINGPHELHIKDVVISVPSGKSFKVTGPDAHIIMEVEDI